MGMWYFNEKRELYLFKVLFSGNDGDYSLWLLSILS